MRRITRLRITIQPWINLDGMKELRVEALVDGVQHTTATPFDDDDFKSCFDYLMESSRLEIIRLVKAHSEDSKKSPNLS